jgi:hypothetical protein
MSEAKQIEVTQINVNIPEPFSTLVELIGKKSELEDIINNKLKLNLDDKTLKLVLDIFELLTKNSDGTAPIRGIIEKIKEILADGKLDTYDIPILVKIVTDILNLNMSNFKNIKFGVKEVGIVVKIIIMTLVRLDVIKNDEVLIMKMIDSSLALLETTIAVSNVKCKWPCC